MHDLFVLVVSLFNLLISTLDVLLKEHSRLVKSGVAV
jgi:hypothetical protein